MTWLQRRRNRSDLAVFGAILQGDCFVLDIQNRIGGSSGRIYLALGRLVRAGLVTRTQVGADRVQYTVSEYWTSQPYSYYSDRG